MDYPALRGHQERNPSPSSACLTLLNPMPSPTEEPHTHTPTHARLQLTGPAWSPIRRRPRIESFVSAQSCSRSTSHTHRPRRSTVHIVPTRDQSSCLGAGPAPFGPIWLPEPARARAPFTLSVTRISNTSSSGTEISRSLPSLSRVCSPPPCQTLPRRCQWVPGARG